VSEVRGVGSSRPGEDEDALADVGSADLRSGHADPFRIEPEGGQVAEYGSKSSKNPACFGLFFQSLSVESQSTIGFCGEEAFDIFDHHQLGSEYGYGAGEVVPQSGAGVGGQARALTGRGDVGAGEAAGEDVGLAVLVEDALPADLRDVAEVRHGRPVAGQDAGSELDLVFLAVLGRLVLGVPGDGAAEHGADGFVELPGAGEQGAAAGGVHVCLP
jgi:hypothetical protein